MVFPDEVADLLVAEHGEQARTTNTWELLTSGTATVEDVEAAYTAEYGDPAAAPTEFTATLAALA